MNIAPSAPTETIVLWSGLIVIYEHIILLKTADLCDRSRMAFAHKIKHSFIVSPQLHNLIFSSGNEMLSFPVILWLEINNS